MKRTVPLLVLAFVLVLSTAAFAGGEKCAHDAKAASAHNAHNARQAALAAHGWLGLKTAKEADGGYRVMAVTEGSPAAQAGFRTGDVLLALNGVALTDANHEAVHKAKGECAVGKQVTYKVRRDGAEKTLTATLAPVPDAVLAEWLAADAKSAQVAQRSN
ncbi:MAG TPA: PDZ domain-containing protein [Thermoanaerobaculia bacterium]|jgi:predicted metalloprotease with PDZ domain|nr:PDZ domain-containing protein [Thermoanaerobaculia bacterium]